MKPRTAVARIVVAFGIAAVLSGAAATGGAAIQAGSPNSSVSSVINGKTNGSRWT